jgi:hypothetical protein
MQVFHGRGMASLVVSTVSSLSPCFAFGTNGLAIAKYGSELVSKVPGLMRWY